MEKNKNITKNTIIVKITKKVKKHIKMTKNVKKCKKMQKHLKTLLN